MPALVRADRRRVPASPPYNPHSHSRYQKSNPVFFHRPVFWLLVPYSLSYCAQLFLLPLHSGVDYDRYDLGLMPVAIILLIRLYELHIGPRLPAISAVTAALFALLAIAGTHDFFASQRARLAAIAHLRAAGIPRTAIEGGFEYDRWTEIENGGHVL